MSTFANVPQLPRAHYEVQVGWDSLEWHLDRYARTYGLELSPDYQREHVWTTEQQIAYVEYCLMGGEVARVLTFNCIGWDSDRPTPMQLVDGKQRLTAVLAFMKDEIKAFGHLRSEHTDYMPDSNCNFRFRVCKLKAKADVLRLYLNINAGGTPHTTEEIEKVRNMLKNEKKS